MSFCAVRGWGTLEVEEKVQVQKDVAEGNKYQQDEVFFHQNVNVKQRISGS